MSRLDSQFVGQQLGEYRILEPIGAGGMGEVFLAEHVAMGKLYALKVLPEELAADREFAARFRDEARVMADLRHEHIVQVHYMGQDRGRSFLVMDFVLGPGGEPLSLHDHLRKLPDGRLPQKDAIRWMSSELLAAASQQLRDRKVAPG